LKDKYKFDNKFKKCLSKFSKFYIRRKGMFSVKGFLIDRDGVLAVTDGAIPWEHDLGRRRVYKYVKMSNQDRFPKIGICTGREYGSAESALFDIGLPNWWSIIESGVFLFNRATKEIRENPALTPEVKEAFQEISQKRIPSILAQYPDDLFLYPGNQICIAIELTESASITIEQANQIIKGLVEDLVQRGLVTVHHSSIAVDLNPANINKASGVRFLCEVEEIDPSDLFGIGDSPGDFPMFEVVGRIGCPSNATDKCKEVVGQRKGIISDKSYAAGVADILHRVTGVRWS
jgi:hydroxymethylpyrimidine pyrophosphatase-like HAD family hydrolase